MGDLLVPGGGPQYPDDKFQNVPIPDGLSTPSRSPGARKELCSVFWAARRC
jgi:hypothetical protein